jgi:hypothetical protein
MIGFIAKIICILLLPIHIALFIICCIIGLIEIILNFILSFLPLNIINFKYLYEYIIDANDFLMNYIKEKVDE